MDNEYLYKRSASMIFWSVLIVALLPVIETLFATMNFLEEMSHIGDDPMEYVMWAIQSASDPDFGDFVPLITFVCYIFFFVGLIKFAKAQNDDEDAYDVRRIKNAILLFMIGDFIVWITPGLFAILATIIYLILNLIGYILIIGGTSRLGRSITMSADANRGFKTLKHVYIWSLIFAILSVVLWIIPYLPLIIKLVLSIFMLVGWNSVRISEPFEYEEEVAPQVANKATQTPPTTPVDEFDATKALLDTLNTKSLEELTQIVTYSELYSPQYHTAAKVAIAEREKAMKPLSSKTDAELREIVGNTVVYAPTHVLAAKDELWRRANTQHQ